MTAKHPRAGDPNPQPAEETRPYDSICRALFMHSLDAVLLTDPQGGIYSANPAACELFGRTEAELCQIGRSGILDSADPRLAAAVEERRRTGRFRGELTFIRKDGSRFIGDISSVVFKDEEGRDRTSMIIRDVTERKRDDDLLRERAAELDAVHQASQRLQLLHSPEDLAQEIIQVLETVIGYEYGAVLLIEKETNLLRPFAVSAQGQGERFVTLDKAYINSHSPQVGKGITGWVAEHGESVRLGDVTQDPRYYSMRTDIRSELCVPLRVINSVRGVVNVETSRPNAYSETDQRVLETIAAQIGIAIRNTQLYENMHRELAERQRVEAELRESEDKFKYVFDHSIIGKSLTYLSGELHVNEAFCRMLGYSLEELNHRHWREFTHPDDVAMNDARNNEMLSGEKESVRYTKRYIHKSGAVIWGDVASSLRRDSEGRPLYFITAVMDVTEQKRIEQELRRRVQDLQVLYDVNQNLSSHGSPQEIGQKIITVLKTELDWHHAVIRLKQEGSDELRVIGYSAEGITPDMHEAVMARLNAAVPRAGCGLTGWAFQNDQTFRSGDVTAEPLYAASFSDIHSGLYVPMKAGDQVIGVISVENQMPNAFDENDQRLLETLAKVAASAVLRSRLYDQTERQLHRLETLRNIDLAITSVIDLHKILEMMLTQIVSQLEVDAADFLLFNPVTQMLECQASRGFRSAVCEKFGERLNEGDAGRAAYERRIISRLGELRPARTSAPRAQKISEEGFVSHIAAPLIAKGQVKGVLELFHRAPLAPDVEWQEFLKMLAGQAAIAIDNVTLFEELQRSNMELITAYDQTIEGWSSAMDLRDKETEGHTLRVTELSLQLAGALGMSAEEMVQIRRGALLHDIGKIGVPDEVLRKPGPLNDEEWVVMRRHPQLAHDMLMPIYYLRGALDIPYCHHEDWDGRGYPRGLKGEEIPLAARIFAVVDVFDALTSDRPYRAAWSAPKALAYIQEQAGKRFDPHIVDIFIQMQSSV